MLVFDIVYTMFQYPVVKFCSKFIISGISVVPVVYDFRFRLGKPTKLTSDSNLFVIEFILRWSMIILCGFWLLSCLSFQMPLEFLSIIGSEGGISNFSEALGSISSD